MLPTHPNHVWTPQLSQALLVSLCSKARSSSATKGLICHLDHLHRQQCHCGCHPPLAVVTVSAWLERPSTHGPALGNVITPARAVSPHVRPQGAGLGPGKVMWRQGTICWCLGTAHTSPHTCCPPTQAHTHSHRGAPPHACVCTQDTRTHTTAHVNTHLCVRRPGVRPRGAHPRARAHAGGCTGKPTVAQAGVG